MKSLFENWRKHLNEYASIPPGVIGRNIKPSLYNPDNEEVLEEGAQGIDDLPEDWYIKITDTVLNDFSIIRAEIVQKINDKFERVPGKTTPFSIIQAMGAGPIEEDPCLGAYIVQKSSGPEGFGPLLYDIILELAGERGVAPDRMTVSKDALGVWDFYLNNRDDVKKAQLDDPTNTLTPEDDDNCRQDSSLNYNPEDWDKSPLSKVYYKLDREKIEALKAAGKLIEGDELPEKDEPVFTEPDPDVSDDALNSILDDYEDQLFEKINYLEEEDEIPEETPLVQNQPINPDVDILPPAETLPAVPETPKLKLDPVPELKPAPTTDPIAALPPETIDSTLDKYEKEIAQTTEYKPFQDLDASRVSGQVSFSDEAPISKTSTHTGHSFGGQSSAAAGDEEVPESGLVSALQRARKLQRQSWNSKTPSAATQVSTTTQQDADPNEKYKKLPNLSSYQATSNIVVRQGKASYATPGTHKFLDAVGKLGHKFYVGDMSLKSGKKWYKHASHHGKTAGRDMDIGYPLKNGGSSITPKGDSFKFRNVKAKDIDFEKFIHLIVLAAKDHNGKQALIDKSFIKPMQQVGDEMVEKGTLSAEDRKFLNIKKKGGIIGHHHGHGNHVHLRRGKSGITPSVNRQIATAKTKTGQSNVSVTQDKKILYKKRYTSHFKKLGGSTIIDSHKSKNPYVVHSSNETKFDKPFNVVMYFHGKGGSPRDFNSKMQKRLPPNTVFVAPYSGQKPGGKAPAAGFLDHVVDNIAKQHGISRDVVLKNMQGIDAYGHSAGGGTMSRFLSNSPYLNRVKNIQFNDATYGWDRVPDLMKKVDPANTKIRMLSKKGSRTWKHAQRHKKRNPNVEVVPYKGTHGNAKYQTLGEEQENSMDLIFENWRLFLEDDEDNI